MHFNIYIDDQTGQKLNKFAKELGKNRNSLIREAIEAWITHHVSPQWPKDILRFEGEKNFPPFEKYRKQLKEPKEDPLS